MLMSVYFPQSQSPIGNIGYSPKSILHFLEEITLYQGRVQRWRHHMSNRVLFDYENINLGKLINLKCIQSRELMHIKQCLANQNFHVPHFLLFNTNRVN